MNDNYKCAMSKDNLPCRKVTGRYDTSTFVDVPLTPRQENKWVNKLKNMRDALVEGTMQSSEYTPITATKNIKLSQKGRCDKCTIC